MSFEKNRNQLFRVRSYARGNKTSTKKIEVILTIAQHKTEQEVRSFLGMVQYYRDLWQKRSHVLASLTELTGGKKTKKFE